MTSRAISIDPNYADRRGYDPAFLGVTVPLPALSAEMQKHVAKPTTAEPATNILRYHHFSIVMNEPRRLAYYTAVNIDGRAFHKLKRERDKWTYDPRIARAAQMGAEIYLHNALDLGHLVRRIDPAWGDAAATAKVANDDTFHYTNCAPQHRLLNENKTTWAGLEDYILTNTVAQQLKVSVFSGPVFATDDLLYRDVQIPQQYWKVVVMVKTPGQLSATAYLLDQSQLIANLGARDFAFGEYRMFQVTVTTIETLTGLQFGTLPQFDPLANRRGIGMLEITSLTMIQL